MQDMMTGILHIIKKELERSEWKKDVFRPLMKWFMMSMIPYAIGVMCINFFLTIAAVSLVLYLYRR